MCRLEDVADAGAPRWMQVFIYRDRGFTKELAERAAAAGYDALVLTTDNQMLGNRERDIRNGFSIPPKFGLVDMIAMAGKVPWLRRMVPELSQHHLWQLCAGGRENRHWQSGEADVFPARHVDVLERC